MRSCICAQSSERLLASDPIVVCELGHLFKKEAILSALLNKSLNPAYSHIRGMRDLKTMIATPNPSLATVDESLKASTPLFICPVTQMEFTGLTPFVVIWSTGYLLSEKAIREIGIESLQAEYGPFIASDIVKLIPSEDELRLQRKEMEARRSAAKADKKGGKKKRSHEAAAADGACVDSSDIPSGSEPGLLNEGSSIKSTNNGEHRSKAAKLDSKSSAVTSAANTSNSSAPRGNGGSITSANSLAKQATAAVEQQELKSSVFKSLFHKGLEADKKDRDLFMSVAGLRYTLR
jgi:hypothetical protein